MDTYLSSHGTRRTPQSEPIPGSDQVENSAGGFVWEVTPWTRLTRFLILGSEGGSYYASEHDLTKENVGSVRTCIKEDGVRVVQEVVDVSLTGRAPKQGPTLFVLAMASAMGDTETRKAAYDAIGQVCRTATMLFEFLAYRKQFAGWTRGLRRAVDQWYGQDADKVAFQVIKYRNRSGYTHRDILRLAHPSAPSPAHRAIFGFLSGNVSEDETGALPEMIEGFVRAQASKTPGEAAAQIRRYGLPWEAVPDEHRTSTEVWEALLEKGMPMGALIRNLATLSRLNILTPTSSWTSQVVEQLGDGEALRKARVHPIQVLAAMLTYASGYSIRGNNTWSPVSSIVDALDGAFYKAFGNVEPIGNRILFALDVSGSMSSGEIAGIPGLTPRVGSSAMALVTAAVEMQYEFVAFTSANRGGYGGWRHNTALTPLAISPRQRIDDVCEMTERLDFGGTDCALPMLYAIEKKREIDTFIVYTDSETWAGDIQPTQALRQYREQFNPAARLVVVGMTSNGFSIADPTDPGMMDVIGFDTAAPNLISSFARGEI